MEREGVPHPSGHPAGIGINHGMGNLDASLPVLLEAADIPAKLKEVWMVTQMRGDFLQFLVCFPKVTQLQPALGGEQVMDVRWFHFVHAGNYRRKDLIRKRNDVGLFAVRRFRGWGLLRGVRNNPSQCLLCDETERQQVITAKGIGRFPFLAVSVVATEGGIESWALFGFVAPNGRLNSAQTDFVRRGNSQF